MGRAGFVRRSVIFIALASLPLLLWRLFGVVLLTTGAVLVAVLIHLVAKPSRFLRVPRGLALMLSGLLIAAVLGGRGFNRALVGFARLTRSHNVTRGAAKRSSI